MVPKDSIKEKPQVGIKASGRDKISAMTLKSRVDELAPIY